MSIRVDPRVGSKHLVKGFTALKVEHMLSPLSFGDCAFFGNGVNDTVVSVGVELKNIHDLVQSMHTGRLAGHQIPGLVETYDQVWLVVEGFYRARRQDGLVEIPYGKRWLPLSLGRRPVFWRELEGFLTSLEVLAGIRVRRTRTPEETARFIETLYRWWQKPFEDHKALHVVRKPQPEGMELRREPEATKRARQVAACMPGIGWGRSRAVVERFGSVQAIIGASEAEWADIPGIGAKIASNVHKAIRETASTTVPKAGHAPRRGPAVPSLRPAQQHRGKRVAAATTVRRAQPRSVGTRTIQ